MIHRQTSYDSVVLNFSFPKRQVHICSMPATSVPGFRLVAKELWEELNIQAVLVATDG